MYRRICQYRRKSTQFQYFKLKFFQCPYRRVCQFRRIVWTFEVFITNLFRFIMNDVNFYRLNFLNPLFLNFCFFAFGGVLKFKHFGDLLHLKHMLNFLQRWKLFKLWRVFKCLRVFNFWTKLYFCPHLAESANIAENAQYRSIFLPRNFRRYSVSLGTKFKIQCIQFGNIFVSSI